MSLHVYVLVWLCQAESPKTCVSVCALGVQAKFVWVFLPCYGSDFTWKKKLLSSSTGPPSSGQNKLPKADPSCLPSLRLSGDFNHSALCQGPSTSSCCSLFRGLAFFQYLPPFWLMLFTLTPHVCWFACHRGTKWTPRYSATCLSSSSLCCVFIVWRIKNCLRCACWRPSCSALTTPEPCHAFDCATVSIYPFRGSCPHTDWQWLFLFDVLVTFLRCMRGINVWQKFIFGVSLLLNSIFSA